MGITCEDKCEEAGRWVVDGGVAKDQSGGGEADREDWVIAADEDAVCPVMAVVVVAAGDRGTGKQENEERVAVVCCRRGRESPTHTWICAYTVRRLPSSSPSSARC